MFSTQAASNPTSVSRTLKGHFVVSFFDVVSGEAVGRIAGESLLITVIEPGHCMVSADCSITGSVDAICVTGRSLVNGALDPGFP